MMMFFSDLVLEHPWGRRLAMYVDKTPLWPCHLAVRMPDFHSGNRGSTPLRVTNTYEDKMKFSPKQLLVRKYVKTKMIWHGTFCHACHYRVIFETMYKVTGLGKKRRGSAYFCWDCCHTKEEAFDLIFPKKVTAQDIIIRNEKVKVRQILHDLIDDLNSLPDGEVSPSVHNAILRYSLKC